MGAKPVSDKYYQHSFLVFKIFSIPAYNGRFYKRAGKPKITRLNYFAAHLYLLYPRKSGR
jgi:hypothetical protein